MKEKKTGNSLFGVTMGSFDGAEVCKLVDLHFLHKKLSATLAYTEMTGLA